MKVLSFWFFQALFITFLATPVSLWAVDFQVGWELDLGASSNCVTLVDIDGDTDLDAYVCDQNTPDRLWLNDGNGVFTRSSQVLDGGIGSGAAFGLLNGDAFPDLFLAKLLDPNKVYFNDMNGMLTDSGQSIGAGESRRAIALGELNGDATIDAFIPSNTSASGSKVYFNGFGGDPLGTFSDSGQDLGSSFGRDVVLVDLGEDGNGDLDAIVGNNGLNRVWFNDGTGTFTESMETVGSGGTFGVAVDFINNDGFLDVFLANGSTSGDQNEVWYGDGDGTFTNSGQVFPTTYGFSVVLGDFDNQNGPDAFVGNNAGIMDVLYLNDGMGNLSDAGETLGVGAAIEMGAGLINNDAHLDVYVANRYQPDQVWLGDGAGNFTDSGQLLGSSEGQSVALADIDGDNDIDAVLGNIQGTIRVFTNDGNGNFTDTNQWLTHGLGNNNGVLRLADLDGINGPDIYAGISPSGTAGDRHDRIWLNDGSGNFTDSGQMLGTENTGALAIGNVDGDSDLDVFVGNAPYNAMTGVNVLYLNSGGTMTDSGQSFGDGNTRAAELVDMDDDGDLDLFIGNINEPSRVYLNGEGGDPLGTFSDTGQSIGSEDTFAVAFGLINNDDHIDFFEGTHSFNKVWFGDGAGNFTDSGNSIGGNRRTSAVHLFDADGNGTLDVWVTNGVSGNAVNKVFLNDGNGNFSDSGLSLGNSASQDSAMALLNGDDMPDVFVANVFGDHRVWLNDTTIDPQQIITPTPGAQNASIGDPVSIDVSYSTSDDDETLSGISLRLHWDSTQLNFVDLTSIWPGGLILTDSSCQPDAGNFDGDPDTDCFVEGIWSDGGGNWPGMGNTPTPLYSANFNSNVDFEQTTNINFSASMLAPGYVLNAISATVTNPDVAEPEYVSDPPGGSTLPFGDVLILTTSTEETVRVDNIGDANLTLSCDLTGTNAAEFAVTLCNSPVLPGGFRTLAVVCEPDTVGAKSATLEVTTNDLDEMLVSYPLTCNGVAEPEFDADPIPGTLLDFGSVLTFTTSSPQTIDVDNLGNANLDMACELVGGDSDQFTINNCSTPVAPAGMTQLSVSCQPTTEGVKMTQLNVVTNDPDEMNNSWPLTCNALGNAEILLDNGFEDP